jgi:hypothetical protein
MMFFDFCFLFLLQPAGSCYSDIADGRAPPMLGERRRTPSSVAAAVGGCMLTGVGDFMSGLGREGERVDQTN